MKLYFICDESGAKGYADKTEKYPGEVGVFAGYFLTEQNIEYICDDLDDIITEFKNKYPSLIKFHVTDLEPKDQEAIRARVFSIKKPSLH